MVTVTSNQPTLEAAIDTVANDPTEADSATEPDEPVTFGEGFPDDVDAAAAQATHKVLQTAPSTDRVYALVSGSYDSLTAIHVVH